MLCGAGEDLIFGPVLRPALRISPGAVVSGDDAVACGLAVFAPEIQAFAVAGDPDPRHILRVDACLAEDAGDHAAVGLPHFLHIPFYKAGFRSNGSRRDDRLADFLSASVKERGLGRCSAVIQSDKIMHFVSPFRLSGSFPPRRVPSSVSGTLSQSAPCATACLPCGQAPR